MTRTPIHPRTRLGLLAAAAATWLGGATSAAPPANPTFEASWTQLGGGPQRYTAATLPPPPFTSPRWVCNTDVAGHPVIFLGQSPLAVYAGEGASDGMVFTVGLINADLGAETINPYRLFAISRATGQVAWQSVIAAPTLESNPGPGIDEAHRTVIVASGRQVQAMRLSDGAAAWSFSTTSDLVNVSPLIVDRRGAGRVLITDYNGGITSTSTPEAKLYCINTDAFDAVANPYQPGQLVWQVSISTSSGNSVSFLPRAQGGDDLVFVASPGRYRTQAGSIRAYRLDQTTQSITPVWTRANPSVLGYFGGVVAMPPESGSAPGTPGSIYAATYSFFGGIDSANLVKINARTGTLVWSAPANRTQSIPVPVPGGLVALSTGLNGYSTIPALELFLDGASSGQLLWHTDLTLDLGGWTNQPVLARFGGRTLLAIGSPAYFPDVSYDNPYDLSNTLSLVDLSLSPSSPGFLVQQFSGVGGSPAIVGGSLYAVGVIGLAAFGPTPSDLDVNQSGTIDVNDLYAWERGEGLRDIDRDGVVDARDKALLVSTLRGGETAALKGGRP